MTINNDSRHCKCVLGENRPWLRIPDLWGKVFQISIRDPRSPYPLLLQCPHPIVSGSIFSSLFELGLYLISALYQDFSSLWEEDQKRTQERCFPMGQSFLGGRRGELRVCLRETASCPILPRSWTTLSHTPCSHRLVSCWPAMKRQFIWAYFLLF